MSGETSGPSEHDIELTPEQDMERDPGQAPLDEAEAKRQATLDDGITQLKDSIEQERQEMLKRIYAEEYPKHKE